MSATSSEPAILLELRRVSRRFGSVVALDAVDLNVAEGEFVTLLGPSGCGKTTLLRIVAGFEQPTSGEVLLGGADLTRVPPYRRPVNTVFQRSILFPHLNVFDNVAFGLRLARVPKAEIARRVREMLELVRLCGLERRASNQVSGGQAQRIALARALINRPRILLLDEPLSALDQAVRQELQGELRRIHRETGTTFLYVTHDQEEAMSMSDRVVVMNHGAIEQVGSPNEVYHQPATSYVASFVGDANLLRVQVVSVEADLTQVRVDGIDESLPCAGAAATGEGWLVLRPEMLRIVPAGSTAIDGRVVDVAFRGSSVVYTLEVGRFELRVEELGDDVEPRYGIGDWVAVGYNPSRARFLPDWSSGTSRAPKDAVGSASANVSPEEGSRMGHLP
jgi:spermidine/putrescine transport system ATP-binding protein